MADLIEALKIFLKYDNPEWPTHCEHDILTVHISEEALLKITTEDKKKLDDLGFLWNEGDAYWFSYKFGSC